jgi:hypothetical protein
MNNTKNTQQSGFTAFESVIVVALIAAIGVAIYFGIQASSLRQAIKPSPSPVATVAATPLPSPANLTAYTQQDITLMYPNGWKVQSSTSGASSLTILGSVTALEPTGDQMSTANVHVLEYQAGTNYLQAFLDDQGFTVAPTKTAITINGNPGYLIKEVNSLYTDIYYVVSHGTHAVYIDFRPTEVSGSGSTKTTNDNSKYQAQFEAIAGSLKFVQ